MQLLEPTKKYIELAVTVHDCVLNYLRRLIIGKFDFYIMRNKIIFCYNLPTCSAKTLDNKLYIYKHNKGTQHLIIRNISEPKTKVFINCIFISIANFCFRKYYINLDAFCLWPICCLKYNYLTTPVITSILFLIDFAI